MVESFKAGPPSPPPQAACRSEHGAILPQVGIARERACAITASPLCRLGGRFRLAVVLTALHYRLGDPRQRHRGDRADPWDVLRVGQHGGQLRDLIARCQAAIR